MTETTQQIALVGAGPCGLAAARALSRHGIDFQGFEAHIDVGGLWNIHNPRSTVYDSAHLISSKRMTEFTEFPMDQSVADYPSHKGRVPGPRRPGRPPASPPPPSRPPTNRQRGNPARR